jgi:hypothetical protein
VGLIVMVTLAVPKMDSIACNNIYQALNFAPK